MSQSNKKSMPLLLALMLAGGCILGPQPEPPDMNETAGNRECPPGETDEDCDCDPTGDYDDDGDGLIHCFDNGAWAGEDDACNAGTVDGDADSDADPSDREDEPPPDHDGDDGPVTPTQDLVQWPHDPSEMLEDDSDVDTITVD